MKAIIICDYFEESVEKKLKKYCKPNYNKSGLNYEEGIYNGFVKVLGEENVQMFCCPTCGTFPNESRLFYSPEFVSQKKNVEYVGFLNLLYVRNLFRYFGLKEKIKRYLKSLSSDEELLVIVVQMHYPFMKACRYIKKVFPKAKACINIWDFPNFVDFRNNGFLKKQLKEINYCKTMKSLADYDLLFYLCEGMNERVPFDKKYIVHEGIIASEQIERYKKASLTTKKDGKFHVIYTGRLTKQDGVLALIDSISQINDGSIVLEIAGGGEEETVISELATKYDWLFFRGLLGRDEIVELQCRADLFVLARLPEEYTNYSFPSKMTEYILTKKPILARPLGCFNSELRSRLFLLEDEDNDNLATVLKDVINQIKSNPSKEVDYSSFVNNNLDVNVAHEIIDCLKR